MSIRTAWGAVVLIGVTPLFAMAQAGAVDPGTTGPAWSPYLVGTLIGMLLLRDFTVLKVILSAVVVGMLGIYALHTAGLVKLHIKPTRYGANILGGLIFGIGFGLAAYCPGTGAAALGQGNFDALAVIVGMLAGSYLFAEASGWIARTVHPWGDRGKLTLADLFHARPALLVPVMAASLVLVLAIIHFLVDPTP